MVFVFWLSAPWRLAGSLLTALAAVLCPLVEAVINRRAEYAADRFAAGPDNFYRLHTCRATGAHQAGWAVSRCSPPSRELGICGDR
jgi:hypothetical protein